MPIAQGNYAHVWQGIVYITLDDDNETEAEIGLWPVDWV